MSTTMSLVLKLGMMLLRLRAATCATLVLRRVLRPGVVPMARGGPLRADVVGVGGEGLAGVLARPLLGHPAHQTGGGLHLVKPRRHLDTTFFTLSASTVSLPAFAASAP